MGWSRKLRAIESEAMRAVLPARPAVRAHDRARRGGRHRHSLHPAHSLPAALAQVTLGGAMLTALGAAAALGASSVHQPLAIS